MLFNSFDFLIFFPIVIGIYFVLPSKAKNLWLLASSYFFYACWSVKYVLLIAISTVITYACGVLLERGEQMDDDRRRMYKRCCLVITLTANLLILFVFKYWNFAARTLGSLLGIAGVPVSVPELNLLLPVGISFYTFQALGYAIDVYRGTIKAEKNFIQYALFVSFFPQLVAGPIERAGNLLKQLRQEHHFDFEQFRDGALIMIWGYFLKLVLADRIAIVVNTVYGDCDTYGGWYLILATVLFAFQIYCDFAGYSAIAIGAAEIMGFRLMENFNAPYLAESVADFWHRWHISLSTWFKDYLYIPLGGNRKGKGRKFLNLLIVFAVSGLWHGAGWTFVIWGCLNGIYQIAGSLSAPLRRKALAILQINPKSLSHRLLKVITTFLLVDFSWLFFRAENIGQALSIIKSIFRTHNPWILMDGSLYNLGLSQKSFQIMILSLAILLFADVMKYKGICVRKVILEQDWWFRWLVIAGSVLMISLVGIWGVGYDASSFIYFQF